MVRVRYLPAESATATILRDGREAWSLEHVLLAHVWQAAAQSKKPHPALADEITASRSRRTTSPGRARKLADARRRAADRKARLEGGS